MQYVLGADIGGTHTRVGLFSDRLELIDKKTAQTGLEGGSETVFGSVAAAVGALCKNNGVSTGQIIGLGVGVPGPVGEDGVVNRCNNLGWPVTDTAGALGALTGLRVKAENDARLAALAELELGAGRGFTDFVMLTLGTGIGGGVVQNGCILRGAHNAAGEIGHMRMRFDEAEQCSCGKHGCLEQYASGTGIVRLAKKAADESGGRSVLCGQSSLTAKAVWEAAEGGDAAARGAVSEAAAYLGAALANVACVCDPQLFILGGGVAQTGPAFIEAVAENYRAHAFHALAQIPVTAAALGPDAGLYGAALLALH